MRMVLLEHRYALLYITYRSAISIQTTSVFRSERLLPITGTYIIDEDCKPVPIGGPGEIAICGPGVASEYLDLVQRDMIPFISQCSFHQRPKSGPPPRKLAERQFSHL